MKENPYESYAASTGAILMAWLIGIIDKKFGISTGMTSNIIPCAGMLGSKMTCS